jgi:hypothetical protein
MSFIGQSLEENKVQSKRIKTSTFESFMHDISCVALLQMHDTIQGWCDY